MTAHPDCMLKGEIHWPHPIGEFEGVWCAGIEDPDATEPRLVPCIRCLGGCYYQDARHSYDDAEPADGWWIHVDHPADGHDAEPAVIFYEKQSPG